MKNFSFLIAIIFFSGCFSNYHFKDRVGNDFKMRSPPLDHSSEYFARNDSFINAPTLAGQFFRETGQENIFTYRYISVGNLEAIVRDANKLVVFFWNPKCPGENDLLPVLKMVDNSKVPVILISLSYDTLAIRKKLMSADLAPNNVSIIPATKTYSNMMILKQWHFIQDSCPSCYREYRGEIMFARALVFNKGNEPKLIMAMEYSRIENALQ